MQAKGVWARDDLRAEGRDLLELLHALLERPVEPGGLIVDGVHYHALALRELAVVILEHGYGNARAVRKLCGQADVAPVQRRAADEAPQNVAATFVGRHDAIRDAERHGADVVGDDPLGQRRRLLAVFAHELDQRCENVRLEHVGLALEDEADALEPHPGVDRRQLERHERSVGDATLDRLGGGRRSGQVSALVVLREHEVPELCKAGAVIRVAIGLPAARFDSAVPPDLGIRAAWPAAESPPVVAKPRHVLGGDRGLAGPDLKSLVI